MTVAVSLDMEFRSVWHSRQHKKNFRGNFVVASVGFTATPIVRTAHAPAHTSGPVEHKCNGWVSVAENTIRLWGGGGVFFAIIRALGVVPFRARATRDRLFHSCARAATFAATVVCLTGRVFFTGRGAIGVVPVRARATGFLAVLVLTRALIGAASVVGETRVGGSGGRSRNTNPISSHRLRMRTPVGPSRLAASFEVVAPSVLVVRDAPALRRPSVLAGLHAQS